MSERRSFSLKRKALTTNLAEILAEEGISLDSGARQMKRKASGSFSSDRGDGKDGDDDARAVDRRRHQPRFLE